MTKLFVRINKTAFPNSNQKHSFSILRNTIVTRIQHNHCRKMVLTGSQS
ncbi:hypothetical protein ALP07_200002 [Pseudomonas savastanoi pv. glycinea]|nr:hypothetical protein ALP07_200002 [Pseudomonas savastanoi pv. glycinea]